MADGERPLLSVVMPVHDGGAVFARCLEALLASPFADREVIVVDDGSTDGSRRVAEEVGVRVLATPTRSGPGAARNLGARAARGEWLLFVDADCEVAPDTLERVAARIRAEPELGALFGSYDDDPAAPGLVARYKNLMHHRVHQAGSEEASTFWAGCGAVRRDLFLAVGGFDVERYPRPAIEDIELGYRLRERGEAIRLAKEVRVKHHKVWRLGELVRTDVLRRGIPWTVLTLERRHLVGDLNLDRRSRAAVALTGLAVALALAAPWLSGHVAVLAAAGAIAALVAVLALEAPTLAFLARTGGLAFAVAAVPLHLLYHLYCGVAFAAGAAIHLWRRLRGR